MRDLKPLEQESTASLIARQLREAIACGDIPMGSQVSEMAFAAQLGVSRGPLREGLQRLTQEGLLRGHRNRGMFVVELNDDDVTDIYLSRSAIERAAAARIHALDPLGTAAALLAVVDAMTAASGRGDVEGVGDADIAFHQVLVSHARSRRLQRFHDTLLTETRICIHALTPTYTDYDHRVPEHSEIAKSFEGGDPALTDRLLVAHMDDAVERLTRKPDAAG